MDIGPGDEVIVPAMTFIATANVVELVGAKPVFVDCDPDTLLITSELIKAAITKNTKAVIPVHMYGQMCDVRSIKDALPKGQKISIIEDCAHTFEAKLNGDRPGKYSDAAIFSFYATKNVTCGEGGAITTNDSKLYERIQQSILHGMSAGAADRFKTGQYKHWGMDHLGTKANLPDLLACFLPDQIRTIDERLGRREEISSFYEKSLSGTKIIFPKIKEGVTHSRHLFPIYVGGYYRKKYYHKLGDFKISENWGSGTLTIPLYPDMSEAEQGHVIDFLIERIDPLIKQVD